MVLHMDELAPNLPKDSPKTAWQKTKEFKIDHAYATEVCADVVVGLKDKCKEEVWKAFREVTEESEAEYRSWVECLGLSRHQRAIKWDRLSTLIKLKS